MSWILSAIAALVSWSLFFTVKFKENANPLIRPLSLLIGLLSSAVFLFQIIGRFAVVIPAGEVGVMESLGQVGQKTLSPGIYSVSDSQEVHCRS